MSVRALDGAAYESQGFLCPVPALSPSEVQAFRERFDEYDRSLASTLAEIPPKHHRQFFTDTHVYLPWVHELAARPAVLDAAEQILGPDILLWSTQWFPKRPGDPTFISWHQDGTYWGLRPPKVCTAWIALSPSNDANGCMRVWPGSHRTTIEHIETDNPTNALSRGQEIAVEVDEDEVVSLVLEPGEMSIHHIGLVHGSRPNNSDEPRIGVAARFVAAEVENAGQMARAVMVRGEDRYGHFDIVPPATEMTDGELARRVESVRAEFAPS